MKVDSYRFLPRSFRPLYEGIGPFPGEADPVWAPFKMRLAEARIGLLSSAGLYLRSSQASFDLEAERLHPEWGDPGWRPLPADLPPGELAVAHLHINDEDILADPEVALPARGLARLVEEGMVGAATSGHASVMGYQDRSLEGWQSDTAERLGRYFRDLGADALLLAPV